MKNNLSPEDQLIYEAMSEITDLIDKKAIALSKVDKAMPVSLAVNLANYLLHRINDVAGGQMVVKAIDQVMRQVPIDELMMAMDKMDADQADNEQLRS